MAREPRWHQPSGGLSHQSGPETGHRAWGERGGTERVRGWGLPPGNTGGRGLGRIWKDLKSWAGQESVTHLCSHETLGFVFYKEEVVLPSKAEPGVFGKGRGVPGFDGLCRGSLLCWNSQDEDSACQLAGAGVGSRGCHAAFLGGPRSPAGWCILASSPRVRVRAAHSKADSVVLPTVAALGPSVSRSCRRSEKPAAQLAKLMGEELDVGTAGYERKGWINSPPSSSPTVPLRAWPCPLCPARGPPTASTQRKLKSLGKYSDLTVNTCAENLPHVPGLFVKSFCRGSSPASGWIFPEVSVAPEHGDQGALLHC